MINDEKIANRFQLTMLYDEVAKNSKQRPKTTQKKARLYNNNFGLMMLDKNDHRNSSSMLSRLDNTANNATNKRCNS